MRILHIIDHWGLGGAQRTLADLVRHDSQNQHGIAVIYAHHRRTWPLPDAVKPHFLAQSYPGTLLAIWRLRRLIASWCPDCLHLHLNGSRFVLALAQMGRKAKVAVVWHEHSGRELNTVFGTFWGGVLLHWQRFLLRKVVHVVGNSKSTMRYMHEQLKVPPEKASLIHCMVDSEAIVEQAQMPLLDLPTQADPNARVVGFVGRLAVQKGPDALLEIARCLAGMLQKAQLWIVGEGPEGEALREALERENLSQSVVFWGHREDVYAVMSAMDVIVMPSRFEPFGLVAVEAFVLGKPVIGFAVDGLKEVLGITHLGIAIKERDHAAMIRAITQHLAQIQPFDPLTDHPFLPGPIVQAWHQLYTRVLEQKQIKV